jgi:hypothetical protein
MNIKLSDAAQQDLIEGHQFYEHQSGGLGDYFLDSILAVVESLQLYAGIHALHFGYHRLLVKRFPFAIYHRIETNLIRAYAILDCRRNPVWVRDRLT